MSCHRQLNLYPKFLHISHRENGSFGMMSLHFSQLQDVPQADLSFLWLHQELQGRNLHLCTDALFPGCLPLQPSPFFQKVPAISLRSKTLHVERFARAWDQCKKVGASTINSIKILGMAPSAMIKYNGQSAGKHTRATPSPSKTSKKRHGTPSFSALLSK